MSVQDRFELGKADVLGILEEIITLQLFFDLAIGQLAVSVVREELLIQGVKIHFMICVPLIANVKDPLIAHLVSVLKSLNELLEIIVRKLRRRLFPNYKHSFVRAEHFFDLVGLCSEGLERNTIPKIVLKNL